MNPVVQGSVDSCQPDKVACHISQAAGNVLQSSCSADQLVDKRWEQLTAECDSA